MPRREVTGRKPGVSADRGPPLIGGPPPAVYDIRGFCQAHKISTDHYYRMSRAGLGPVVMRLGHRTLISFRERRRVAPSLRGTAQARRRRSRRSRQIPDARAAPAANWRGGRRMSSARLQPKSGPRPMRDSQILLHA